MDMGSFNNYYQDSNDYNWLSNQTEPTPLSMPGVTGVEEEMDFDTLIAEKRSQYA